MPIKSTGKASFTNSFSNATASLTISSNCDCGTSEGIRDKSLILTGFSGGFRRSELVNIDYDDLEFVNEGVKIFIKRSKTDQSGEGMIKAIPYFDNKSFCPVLSLKDWIENSKIKSGKL